MLTYFHSLYLLYYIIIIMCIDHPQRYNLKDRIVTAVDDYAHMRGQQLHQQTGGAVTACPRVSFSMAELRSFNNLSERLRMDPLRHMRALEAACRSVALEERGAGADKEGTFS
jgi:hypothetical protein